MLLRGGGPALLLLRLSPEGAVAFDKTSPINQARAFFIDADKQYWIAGDCSTRVDMCIFFWPQSYREELEPLLAGVLRI